MKTRTGRLDDSLPNGVYAYDKVSRAWVLLDEEASPLTPKERVSVIYFDNSLCPVCRRYDEVWYPFIDSNLDALKDFGLYIAYCNWFTQNCTSLKAALTFIEYGVKASPTTVLVLSDGGKVLYTERYEGLLTERDLRTIVFSFPERAERALRGEKVERPITEGDMLDLLSRVLKKG